MEDNEFIICDEGQKEKEEKVEIVKSSTAPILSEAKIFADSKMDGIFATRVNKILNDKSYIVKYSLSKVLAKQLLNVNTKSLSSFEEVTSKLPLKSYASVFGCKVDVSFSKYVLKIDVTAHSRNLKNVSDVVRANFLPEKKPSSCIGSPVIFGDSFSNYGTGVATFTPMFDVNVESKKKFNFVIKANSLNDECPEDILVCQMPHIEGINGCTCCHMSMKQCKCPDIIYVKPSFKENPTKENKTLYVTTHLVSSAHNDLIFFMEDDDDDELVYAELDKEIKKGLPEIISEAVAKYTIDAFFKVVSFAWKGVKKVADDCKTKIPGGAKISAIVDIVFDKLDLLREYCVEHPTEVGAVLGAIFVCWKWKQMFNHAQAYYLDQALDKEQDIGSVFPLEGIIGILGDNPSVLVFGSLILREKWLTFIKQDKNETSDIFGVLTKALLGGTGFTILAGSLMVAINFAAYASIGRPRNYYNSLKLSERPKYTALLRTYGYREAIERHSKARRGKNGKKIVHFYADEFDQKEADELDRRADEEQREFEEDERRREMEDARYQEEEDRADREQEQREFYEEKAASQQSFKPKYRDWDLVEVDDIDFSQPIIWEEHSNPRAAERPKKTCSTCKKVFYTKKTFKYCPVCVKQYNAKGKQEKLKKENSPKPKKEQSPKVKKVIKIEKHSIKCSCGAECKVNPRTSRFNKLCSKCFAESRGPVRASKIERHAKIPVSLAGNVVRVYKGDDCIGFGTLISKTHLVVTGHAEFRSLTSCISDRINGKPKYSLKQKVEITEPGLIDTIIVYEIEKEVPYVTIARATPSKLFKGKIQSRSFDQVSSFCTFDTNNDKRIQYEVESQFGDCGAFIIDSDALTMVGLHCGVKKNTKGKASSVRIGIGIPFTPFILKGLSAF